MAAAVDTMTAQALKRALAAPGCPLCRLACTVETRQLERLLWENVNDVDTRVRLAESWGFCARHSRQFLRLRLDERSDALGRSIIFEDLIERARRELGGLAESLQEPPARTGRWAAIRRRFLHRAPPATRQEHVQALMPARGCPICEMAALVTEHHARVLATALAAADWQARYAASDGLCLPHVRVVVKVADAGPGMTYLVRETGERLAALQQDLAEFSRKQAWRYRHEAVSAGERSASERAVAFLVGSNLSEEP